jgi:hypothetical protein
MTQEDFEKKLPALNADVKKALLSKLDVSKFQTP